MTTTTTINFTNCEMLSRIKTVWSQVQYKNLMVNFLPHFENPQRSTLSPPPHKKRKNIWAKSSSTPAKFSTVFNSMVYSYVGSKIDCGEEVDLCKRLVDSILKENIGHEEYYNDTALQQGIALLQLLQDEEKRRKDDPRAVGCWAMELLGKRDGGIPMKKLRSACLMFVSSLLNKACDSNETTIDATTISRLFLNDEQLSVSEVGVLVLFALVPLKILKQIKEDLISDSDSCDVAQYTFSKLFVPVCRNHPNAVWKETKELFNDEPRIFEGSKFLKNSKNNFVLISIDDTETLKGWIISNMFSILYKQHRYKSVAHHRDMQLVIEEKTRKVCIQLWGANTIHDLEELHDAVYVEQYGEPCYEFIAFHFTVYLRMLLLINPKYRIRLEEDWNHNSQFLYTSIEVGPYCQLYFYAQTPTKEEVRREMSVDEIGNFLSKFIIKNDWYYGRSLMGYEKDELEPLFEIAPLINKEIEIRAGAAFIAKTLDVEYNDEDKEFRKFLILPNQVMESFGLLIKEIKGKLLHSSTIIQRD